MHGYNAIRFKAFLNQYIGTAQVVLKDAKGGWW